MEIPDNALLVDLRAARKEVASGSQFDYDGERTNLPQEEFLIFGLTHEGSGMVSLRQPTPTTRSIGPGQAYFLRRPGPYRLWYPRGNQAPWVFTFVAVRFYRPNEFAPQLANEYSPVLDVNEDDPLAICVERLAEVFPRPEVRSNRYTRSALGYRFLMELSSHREETTRTPLSPALEEILAYIDENLEKDLSLSDIANRNSCCEDTVMRRFRTELGTTFVSHLAERRYRRAKRLLVTTALPVKVIAAKAGYHSASYFCSVFGRFSGMTPLTYRNTADLCDPDLT